MLTKNFGIAGKPSIRKQVATDTNYCHYRFIFLDLGLIKLKKA